MCNKMAYQTRNEALDDYRLLTTRGGKSIVGAKMYAYLCPCGMWHLTRQRPNGKRAKKYAKFSAQKSPI